MTTRNIETVFDRFADKKVHDRMCEMAKKLLQRGLSIADIVEDSGLYYDEVVTIQKDVSNKSKFFNTDPSTEFQNP